MTTTMANKSMKTEATATASTSTTKPLPNLPHEVIFQNILNRLPAKSVLRFRCVNRHWCQTIDDPIFRSDHFLHSKQNPLLLSFMEEQHSRERFCHFKFHHYQYGPPFFGPINYLSFPTINKTYKIGYCNGLLCIRSKIRFYIFNLTTRQVLSCPFPKLPPILPFLRRLHQMLRLSRMIYGFGFDHLRNEYKVLRVLSGDRCVIYTLGDDSWRDIPATSGISLCSKFFCLKGMVSYVGLYSKGAFYWFFRPDNALVSFDIHNEKFSVRLGPDYPPEPQWCRCMFEWQGRICLAYQNSISEDINIYSCDDMGQTQLAWDKTKITFPMKAELKCKIGVMSYLGHLMLYWYKKSNKGFAFVDSHSGRGRFDTNLSSLLLQSRENSHMKSGLINHTENLLSLKTLAPSSPSQARVMYMNQMRIPEHEVIYMDFED